MAENRLRFGAKRDHGKKGSACREQKSIWRIVAVSGRTRPAASSRQKCERRRANQGLQPTMADKNDAGKNPQAPIGDAAATLGPNNEIGRKLKQYYDELVSEAVPDRFQQLLQQLEQAKPASSKDA
jgi:hypothetical protein